MHQVVYWFIVVFYTCFTAVQAGSPRVPSTQEPPAKTSGSVALSEPVKAPESVAELKLSFSPVVRKVAPAIVSIYALQVVERRVHPLFTDDFFNYFFGQLPSLPQQEISKSMGSGVIISKDGIVVTCAHVVQNAKSIEIKLLDNRQLQGRVVAIDQKNDLAVIKLQDIEGDIPFVPLGQSSSVEAGDLVLAFGNPFGIGHTVTSGIISAATRLVGDRVLVQTDSPINPGNSGGALVNMKGELVGIPNAILSRTGTNLGIGFAIPVSVIKPLLSLKDDETTIKRAWDGIKIETLDSDKAESFGLKNQKGVFVVALHEYSPAKQAGLQASDVIVKINDVPIESEEIYRLKLLEMEVGKEVKYTIKRKGDEKVITFQVIAPPEMPEADETTIKGRSPLSGLKVANLSPALAVKYGLDAMQGGVVILDVPMRGSMFGVSLFEPGDIIEEAGGQKITSVKQFIKLVDDGVSGLMLQRGHKRIKIQIGM